MTHAKDPIEAARFLRTLRVATQTALAHDQLTRGRGDWRPVATFSALAAKGVGEWRFPASGVASADGLVLAELRRESDGATALTLQAQGAAGLSVYADRAVRLRFAGDRTLQGAFDRDGGLTLPLDGSDLAEADLAAFEIESDGDGR
jgi:hypothetical protein